MNIFDKLRQMVHARQNTPTITLEPTDSELDAIDCLHPMLEWDPGMHAYCCTKCHAPADATHDMDGCSP